MVKKLGIDNINIVLTDGGGVMGASVSKSNTNSAVYTGQSYQGGTVKSITAHFYVDNSDTNFGSFTLNCSYP